MTIESALIKPVVDLVLASLKKIKGIKLKADARKAISESIRGMLVLDPNLAEIQAKIRKAKASGDVTADLIRAEEMLHKVQLALESERKRLNAAIGPRTSKKLPGKRAPAKKAPPAKKSISMELTYVTKKGSKSPSKRMSARKVAAKRKAKRTESLRGSRLFASTGA